MSFEVAERNRRFFLPENGRFALHIPKLYGKNTKKRMIC